MSDRITLTGLRVFGRHGVFEHEKRDGQEFVVDVTAWLDLGPAAASDDLTKTLHYGELAELAAGIKKDVVVSNRLKEKPDRVAIYGWHRPDGKPIQPLSAVHREDYVDYSHGIRLVKAEVVVGREPMPMAKLLGDPDLCGLVSDEGPISAGYRR